MTAPARQRYSEQPFPPYRHIPGRTPHPTRDPEGHSYGREEPELPDLNTAAWQDCDHYLYGIDLFNAFYWWECHEVLEGLWHASGIGSDAAHVLQAIIQCAAAHLKVETRQPEGARRLFEHSLRHAQWCGDRRLGLNLDNMTRDTRSYLTVREAEPARLVLEF